MKVASAEETEQAVSDENECIPNKYARFVKDLVAFQERKIHTQADLDAAVRHTRELKARVSMSAGKSDMLIEVLDFLDEQTPEDADRNHWAARAYQEIGAKFETNESNLAALDARIKQEVDAAVGKAYDDATVKMRDIAQSWKAIADDAKAELDAAVAAALEKAAVLAGDAAHRLYVAGKRAEADECDDLSTAIHNLVSDDAKSALRERIKQEVDAAVAVALVSAAEIVHAEIMKLDDILTIVRFQQAWKDILALIAPTAKAALDARIKAAVAAVLEKAAKASCFMCNGGAYLYPPTLDGLRYHKDGSLCRAIVIHSLLEDYAETQARVKKAEA